MQNEGTATLTDCTFSQDYAGLGGAIAGSLNGVATIIDCDFIDNTAVLYGGGAYAEATTTLNFTQCTFSGNDAATSGGAVSVRVGGVPGTTASATLINCTVSGNSATTGGGLYRDPTNTGAFTLGNTIVAGNTATTGPDASGTFVSQGHNLIGKTDGSSGWAGSDLTGTVASPLNARLAPLDYYGGPIQTIALLPGSPAIGAGSIALIPAGITTDARGFARTTGGKADIGAFETQSIALLVNTTVDSGGTPLGTLDLRARSAWRTSSPGPRRSPSTRPSSPRLRRSPWPPASSR